MSGVGEELYKGINKALKKYGRKILGGDCSKKSKYFNYSGIQGELEF